MSIDPKKFNALKQQTEEYYKSLGEVYCPYFQHMIIFNSRGLEHLKFNSHNDARPIEQQYTRCKLFSLAPRLIASTTTLQGLLYTKHFERIRNTTRTEVILKEVTYYEFIAVLDDGFDKKRIRVVLKQIEAGPIFFWSIIPFWKMGKQKHRRKMNSENLEDE